MVTTNSLSSEWELSAEIVGEVDTFGFDVNLEKDGTTIAIAAPRAQGGLGQVEVYEVVWPSGEWKRLGEPIVGDNVGDEAGFGMDLSTDGNILAVGYPGNGNGFVRVFEYEAGQWIQTGQTLSGPSPNSKFGATVSLDWFGITLAVGAPLAGDDEKGMVRAYGLYGTLWAAFGTAVYGKNPGDRFGSSVGMHEDGLSIVVGSPNYDSPDGKKGGMAQIFNFVSPGCSQRGMRTIDGCWIEMSPGTVVGCDSGARLGHTGFRDFQGGASLCQLPHVPSLVRWTSR